MENKEKIEIDQELMDEYNEFIEDYENNDAPVKSMWQLAKEQQYRKLNVTEKQLNGIIAFATAALVMVFIIIGLDARGIF